MGTNVKRPSPKKIRAPSTPLAPQDLSALIERQGNDFAAGVALECDLSTYGLGDEDILLERRGFQRRLAGTLDHDFGTRGIDAQTKRWRKGIVALILFELCLGWCRSNCNGYSGCDALSVVSTAKYIPCESVRTVDFAPRLQNGVELKGIELARAVILHFELGLAVKLDGQLVAPPAQFYAQSGSQTVSSDQRVDQLDLGSCHMARCAGRQ